MALGISVSGLLLLASACEPTLIGGGNEWWNVALAVNSNMFVVHLLKQDGDCLAEPD